MFLFVFSTQDQEHNSFHKIAVLLSQSSKLQASLYEAQHQFNPHPGHNGSNFPSQIRSNPLRKTSPARLRFIYPPWKEAQLVTKHPCMQHMVWRYLHTRRHSRLRTSPSRPQTHRTNTKQHNWQTTSTQHSQSPLQQAVRKPACRNHYSAFPPLPLPPTQRILRSDSRLHFATAGNT